METRIPRKTGFALLARTLALALALGSVCAVLAAPAAAAPPRRMTARSLQRRLGYLPISASAYFAEKAAIDQRQALKIAAPETPSAPTAPAVLSPRVRTWPPPQWDGLSQANIAPPDSTGAMGPTRYIEMINQQIGLYHRRGGLVSSATLQALTGHTQRYLSDPQVVFDPATNRFYYEVLDVHSDTIAWGFSKDATPSSIPGDFCNYTANFGYGSNLPDYPKLGMTADFLLIGVNVFASSNTYLGSNIAWIQKPQGSASVTTCPAQSSFALGKSGTLLNGDGSDLATPVPAVQTDSSSTGWVVGNADLTSVASANYITVYRVTKASNGKPNMTLVGSVTVPSYSMPPSAPQAGTTATLDTMDGRLTQAISGFDPQNGVNAVWTVHAVAGGAGSEERWYEIDPATRTLLQNGAAADPNLYSWNGAIAPDRSVTPTGSTGGDVMAMGFNTSSASTYSAIQWVAKYPGSPQSAFRLQVQSPGPNVDFTCSATVPCRWGDYSGAAPDPGRPGSIYFANEWNVASTDNSGVTWDTWVFQVRV